MRILIVDDDLTGRTYLKSLLASFGDVDSAPNGDLALRMVEAAFKEMSPYDLITMDIGLPDIDGQEVVQVIRDIERRSWKHGRIRESKIIMISAKNDAKNIMTSFSSGCEDYLVKPVAPEELFRAIACLDMGR